MNVHYLKSKSVCGRQRSKVTRFKGYLHIAYTLFIDHNTFYVSHALFIYSFRPPPSNMQRAFSTMRTRNHSISVYWRCFDGLAGTTQIISVTQIKKTAGVFREVYDGLKKRRNTTDYSTRDYLRNPSFVINAW